MMEKEILVERIKKIEKELIELKKPKSILGKIFVDKKILDKAKKALFDFDIERFVTKNDLKSWRKK
jgi:hypothetical protein